MPESSVSSPAPPAHPTPNRAPQRAQRLYRSSLPLPLAPIIIPLANTLRRQWERVGVRAGFSPSREAGWCLPAPLTLHSKRTTAAIDRRCVRPTHNVLPPAPATKSSTQHNSVRRTNRQMNQILGLATLTSTTTAQTPPQENTSPPPPQTPPHPTPTPAPPRSDIAPEASAPTAQAASPASPSASPHQNPPPRKP